MNKVIGIGLPKTGTSSLNKILNNNGIKSIHFGSPACNEVRSKMLDGIYTFDVLNRNRGITNAFEMVYPQVDKNYPNSKFIHTVREKNSWLVSIKEHLERSISKGVDQRIMKHHLLTFGCYFYNEDRFSYVYDTHQQMVKEYFKDRPNDVLTVNIIEEHDCVKKICNFLEIPIKNASRVHINKKTMR